MTWRQAGRAWGARAADWATLVEPHQVPVYAEVLGVLGVDAGMRLLDVGCGSGLATTMARAKGAKVAGLDASEALISIARDRSPDGDFRVGDMEQLPWEDASFDVVTSFNAIWAGGDKALAEVRRVLRPGGRVGITFWGNPKRMDAVLVWGVALAELQPPEEFQSGSALLEIGRPGVAEAMLEKTGFSPERRGTVTTVGEFPDLDTAIRALSSPGPAWAAIEHSGFERWRSRLTELLQPYVAEYGIVRHRNEWGYLIGTG